MPRRVSPPPTITAALSAEDAPVLEWRVHLLRREPARLPALVLVVLMGGACVWLMFHAVLPVVAALLLLIGATSEYLFPISYRLNGEGIAADSPTSRLTLRWTEAKRCLPQSSGVVITPLSLPSRLDAFRGVMVRFAPEGEPGDRVSVLAAITGYAPALAAARPLPSERAVETPPVERPAALVVGAEE